MRITHDDKVYELVEFVEPITQTKYDIIGVFNVNDDEYNPSYVGFFEVEFFDLESERTEKYLHKKAIEFLERQKVLSLDDMVTCAWCGKTLPLSECRDEVNMGFICHHCENALRSRGEQLSFDE